MKSLFIIGAHASSLEKQRLLSECITALKEMGMDIMVTSHTVLPESIINSVQYYVYDADNRFNDSDNIFYWSTLRNITIKMRANSAYEHAFIKNVRNALYLAKANEYDFFYWTDFDNIFSKEDINKLLELRNTMVCENKKFIFFKPKDAAWQIKFVSLFDIYYESLLFGGMVDDFLKHIDLYLPKSLETHNRKFGKIEEDRPACMEHYLYAAFNGNKYNSVIIEEFIKNYCGTSKINSASSNAESGIRCMVLPANDGKYYLLTINYNTLPYEFKIHINGVKTNEYTLYDTPTEHLAHAFKIIELKEYCEIFVEMYYNDKLIKTWMLNYEEKGLSKYEYNGSIEIR